MEVGPRHHNLATLQRPAQTIQSLGGEFGELIQEQHAVMRQRHLAGLGAQAAAGQGGHAGRVVRRAKRALAGQGAPGDQPGHRVDHGGLQQLLRGQGRQQARRTLGHHRLARPRRPDEQQVVAPGRGDLQGPLGAFLALHVAQVGRRLVVEHGARLGRAHHLRAAEMVDHRDQRPRGQDLGAAGPGRLRPVGLRADQAQAHGAGRHRRGQHPGHRRDAAVQRQLADRRPAVQGVGRQHPHGRHDAKRDGQVVVAALLGKVGRGQIDHDAPGRQGEAQAGEGAPDPLAALAHRLVAQADDDRADLAAGELDLDLHAPGLDALERHGDDSRDHPGLPAMLRMCRNPGRDQEQTRNMTAPCRPAAGKPRPEAQKSAGWGRYLGSGPPRPS